MWVGVAGLTQGSTSQPLALRLCWHSHYHSKFRIHFLYIQSSNNERIPKWAFIGPTSDIISSNCYKSSFSTSKRHTCELGQQAKQEFSWMQFSVCFSLNHTRSPPCYRRHCCCCSGWLLLVALFIHSPAMADRKDVCISCSEVFLEGNGIIRCNDWEFPYHFGASSGLSEANYI